MKCTNCGAEIADAFAFCTSCGAAKPMTMPSASDDSDKTVLISEDMNIGSQPVNNPFGQPNQAAANFNQAIPQNNQYANQPQTNQFTNQPQMGQPQGNQFTNQFTNQPQMTQPQGNQFTNQFTNQPQTTQPQGNQFTNQFTNQPQMTQPQGNQFTNQFTNQPQMAHSQGNQFTNQFTNQPQMTQSQGNQFTNQFTNQPQMTQPQMTQPQMTQPQMTQPQGNQFTNQFTNQPQMNMGQPQGMYNQPPYGQPNGMYNKPPKAPRKPLSPGAKKGLIAGAIVVVLAIVFFAFILPILTRSKFDGEYTCSESYYYNKLVVDDGTYAYYDRNGDLSEVGTYKVKDNKVTFISLDGYEDIGTFNADDNKIRLSGSIYKSTDKKADLDIKLTETYAEDLEARVEAETEELIKDEKIFEEFKWSYYFIYMDDLKNPTTLYEEALAEALDYENDTTLQQLIESGILTMDIWYDGAEIEVSIY